MKRVLILVVTVASLVTATIGAKADVASTSTISQVAGACLTPGFTGDGGLSTDALVNKPRDTEMGPDGSVYLADTYNNRIRKIAPDGTITTVAGNGSNTWTGAEIPATEVGLYWPHDLFYDDASQVLYIADSNHSRVLSVTPDGIVHVVAGTGFSGYSGDGGLATQAKVKQPKSVFVYGGYLYMADLSNTIRRVDLSTGIISLYAGKPLTAGYADGDRLSAMFSSPQRVQVDSVGNVYVADTLNHAIRRVDAVTGEVTTVAGTGFRGFNGTSGPGTSVLLNQPRGIALEGDGVLFVADSNNQRIRRVDLVTGYLTTVAGSGKGCTGNGGAAINAKFYQPRGLTVDFQGNLIIADTLNSQLRIVQHTEIVGG